MYGIRILELNLIGKIGDASVFGMEIDNSTERPLATEKEVHKPEMKIAKADKSAVYVDQRDKWSVDSFDNLDKWPPVKNGRGVVDKVWIRGEYYGESHQRFFDAMRTLMHRVYRKWSMREYFRYL